MHFIVKILFISDIGDSVVRAGSTILLVMYM